MKKISLSTILLLVFLISAQVTFAETIIINSTEIPDIPVMKGKVSNTLQETSIADFDYILNGSIDSASIEGKWGVKNPGLLFSQISQLDLYLDDILLIDFGQYKKLRGRERIALIKSLRNGGMIHFHIDIDQKDFGNLGDGEAQLYLVGKPKFFRSLRLGETTLSIVDPVFDDVPGIELDGEIQFNGNPVPEPATMLLLGSGLIGLAGYGRKKLFKK